MTTTNNNMPIIKKEKVLSKKEEPVLEKEKNIVKPVLEKTIENEETVDIVEEPISVENQIKSLVSVVEEQIKQLKTVRQSLKSINVLYQKEIKNNKNKKRVKKDNKDYVPHGFTKPVHISSELSTFLGVDKDATVARPSVTRSISIYVKENNLQDAKDGSIFKTDKVLKEILGEPKYLVKPRKPELGVGFSYQNLQTYLAPHFKKI